MFVEIFYKQTIFFDLSIESHLRYKYFSNALYYNFYHYKKLKGFYCEINKKTYQMENIEALRQKFLFCSVIN